MAAFTENLLVKFVAFAIASGLFMWVRSDREATVVAHAAVRIELPDNMVLISPPLDRVRLTVRGRSSDINRFDPTEVPPLSVIASDDDEQTLNLTPDMVQLPVGLEVTEITPEFLRVRLEPLAKKRVAVSPRIAGEPREDYVVGHITLTPAQIDLRGPKSSIDKVEAVSTEVVDVSGRTQTIDRRVQIRLDDPLLRYDASVNFTVHIPIETVEFTQVVDNIPLLAVNTTREANITPKTLTATLRGPRATLDQITSTSLLATVDMSAEDRRGAGTFEKQPVVKNLPAGVTLVDYRPKNVIVSTVPKARAADEP